jgi:hypothetical protein
MVLPVDIDGRLFIAYTPDVVVVFEAEFALEPVLVFSEEAVAELLEVEVLV